MLQTPTFTTFHDAYLAVLRHVSDQPEYRNAPRGNAARECLNLTFTLTNPRDRIVYAPARRTNIVFCYAEALWYLLGRDDLDMIGYYAPRLRKVSDDGVRLTGTAYGPKLFRREMSTWPSQWEQVSELLNTDPATKRAVVAFFHPAELQEPDNPDVSCTIALQFLLREGRLHAVVYMRGNDAVTGLLCDAFSFTLIQEFAAHQLTVQVGGYAHHVGSMHINDTDAGHVARILTAEQQRPCFPAAVMPPTSWNDLKILEQYEQTLRRDEDRLYPEELDRLGLEPYWQQVVLLFEIYRQITHYPATPVEPKTLHALEPGYRWLIAHRWPDRMPTGFAPPAGDQQ
jgi:thymidylate synthase